MNGENSFGFYGGRQVASRLSVQRFDTGAIALVPLAVYAMPNTSTDVLGVAGRNQQAQLKDIALSVYLPICKDVNNNQVLTSSVIAGLIHSYTFFLSVNNQTVQYPITFTQNVQTVRSPLWLASFPDVVKSIELRVRIDNVDPVWQGLTVYLSTLMEFYCVTP